MLNKSETSKDLRAMAADAGLTCKNQKNCGEMVFVGKNVSRASFDLFIRGKDEFTVEAREEELKKRTQLFISSLLQYLRDRGMVAVFQGRPQNGEFVNGWHSTNEMNEVQIESTDGKEAIFNNTQFMSWDTNPARNVHITFRVFLPK